MKDKGSGFGFAAEFIPKPGSFDSFLFMKTEELAKKPNVLTIKEFLNKLSDKKSIFSAKENHYILVNGGGSSLLEIIHARIATDLSSEG